MNRRSMIKKVVWPKEISTRKLFISLTQRWMFFSLTTGWSMSVVDKVRESWLTTGRWVTVMERALSQCPARVQSGSSRWLAYVRHPWSQSSSAKMHLRQVQSLWNRTAVSNIFMKFPWRLSFNKIILASTSFAHEYMYTSFCKYPFMIQ